MAADIHSGHRERMRQRFLKEGGEGFHDHELLEMLLFYAVPRGDTNPLAHKMIKEFGSLPTLIEAEPIDISRLCGVGKNTAILVSLQKELSRRCIQARWRDRPVLNSLSRAVEYCISLMAYKNREFFYVICLDNKRRVINTVQVAEGTVNTAAVHPRFVIEAALKLQASAVILTHNHPGGACKPTFEDIQTTTQLGKLLYAIEVQLIDHIIVADDTTFSFLENKFLNKEVMEGQL
ncbi:RadC family protein [Anaerotignum sp. MB30-C6]|uniref:RadC family protein n=1 Tax=Anaerotignum sp. MB30-C6 TaxID=3070814 RepID=UPI0027DCF88C|nr:DNA repair protein RadC [Anaerotignum sp. MB30-C6]WMI82173.1 DNA repair protein RadC [Anaerotignum sp. MB30-C6]